MRLSWMFMAAVLGCGETDKDSAALAATRRGRARV